MTYKGRTNPPSDKFFLDGRIRPHLLTGQAEITLDDDRKVRLILGAAGGTRITTTILSVMVLHLWNNYTIKEAIDAQRVHHQLFPMEVQYERKFSPSVLNYLHEIGHNITLQSGMKSGVTAVAISDGQVTANSDYRKEGTTAGF